jgi:hypothetical protein
MSITFEYLSAYNLVFILIFRKLKHTNVYIEIRLGLYASHKNIILKENHTQNIFGLMLNTKYKFEGGPYSEYLWLIINHKET